MCILHTHTHTHARTHARTHAHTHTPTYLCCCAAPSGLGLRCAVTAVPNHMSHPPFFSICILLYCELPSLPSFSECLELGRCERVVGYVSSVMKSSRLWPWPRGATLYDVHIYGLGLGLGPQVLDNWLPHKNFTFCNYLMK